MTFEEIIRQEIEKINIDTLKYQQAIQRLFQEKLVPTGEGQQLKYRDLSYSQQQDFLFCKNELLIAQAKKTLLFNNLVQLLSYEAQGRYQFISQEDLLTKGLEIPADVLEFDADGKLQACYFEIGNERIACPPTVRYEEYSKLYKDCITHFVQDEITNQPSFSDAKNSDPIIHTLIGALGYQGTMGKQI